MVYPTEDANSNAKMEMERVIAYLDMCSPIERTALGRIVALLSLTIVQQVGFYSDRKGLRELIQLIQRI